MKIELKQEKSFGKDGMPRRVLGVLCISVGLVMSIILGFKFYDVDTEVLIYTYSTGLALLGIGVLKDIPRKTVIYGGEQTITPDNKG